MVVREVFLMKPKHQNHLSQWGKCVYDAQSWKESILLCESRFIQKERRTSNVKMVQREVFLIKPKHQYHLFHRGKCVYDAQSWKETRLFCESMFIPIERCTSILEMVIGKVFLIKLKHQYL